MSFQDDREGQRRRKPEPDQSPPVDSPPNSKKKKSPQGEVGNALRSAYQRVVAEDIPPEMLDLLGKLG